MGEPRPSSAAVIDSTSRPVFSEQKESKAEPPRRSCAHNDPIEDDDIEKLLRGIGGGHSGNRYPLPGGPALGFFAAVDNFLSAYTPGGVAWRTRPWVVGVRPLHHCGCLSRYPADLFFQL